MLDRGMNGDSDTGTRDLGYRDTGYRYRDPGYRTQPTAIQEHTIIYDL
jgi:hypothetical protein